jgi:RNA polymerase primary sigma factor
MAGEGSDSSLKLYLKEIMRVPLLTPQDEITLAARIKKGDSDARAWMIKANLRLVVKIAHDYLNLGLPFLDLISEGNIGLMKAVERFDPAKGGKLSTYGAWWIKQSIKRALANQSKTIRLPVHLVDKIYRLKRASLQMSEELGREPTDEELAEEIGISSAKLSRLKTVSIRPASLDAPISDDDSTAFGEIVGDEEAQTPFELFRDKNMRDELRELLEVLDDRERKIILQRFGLDDGKPKTLEEVGKKFGVTRERIRQLQNIALAKLRRALSKKETPIIRQGPNSIPQTVSPDPTTGTSVAKATTSPKATLHLASLTRFLEIIPCVPYGMGGVLQRYHAPAQSVPGKKNMERVSHGKRTNHIPHNH